MTPFVVIILLVSVAAQGFAVWLAFQAAERARLSALTAAAPIPPPRGPTREERIAWARGELESCKAVELSLSDHADHTTAAILLAQYRAGAARAKAELRSMGVEP